MKTYLRPAITVSIDDLWPDPNNPRLALADPPGYGDPEKLFNDDVRQQIFDDLGEDAYSVDDLVDAIVGQGWMPIDNIIVWKHPQDGDRYVVVEGNRRRLALERIRTEQLQKEKRKLERMNRNASTYPKTELDEQTELVERLETVVADTQHLPVLPIAADSVEELEDKLPRILAVRHIAGAKGWVNYAEDLYLLQRYIHLFEDEHRGSALFWDDLLVRRVASEASLGPTIAKRKIKSANWFGHFRREWEEELPDGQEFQNTDYYLFEQITRRPLVRQRLGVPDDGVTLPKETEVALFEWAFKLPRGHTADDNPNKFFRHENITLWDQMAKYDQENGTTFALRFDIDNPADAPAMAEVEASYLTHKSQRKPHAVINDLLQRLSELTAEQLASEGQVFRVQLEQLHDQSEKFLKMIEATEG
jgi:hypothetical protein